MYSSSSSSYNQNENGAKHSYPAMNVAAVVGQPYAPPHPLSDTTAYSGYGSAGGKRWSTGLCHCCDDPANCLVTAFCPCITFGQIAEIVNHGQLGCAASGGLYGLLLAFTGFPCLYSCIYRSRMRAEYELEETPFPDCFVHFCCESCALCQEYRHLKNSGFDMSIGWQANIDRQNRGVTVAPPIGTMMR